MATNAEFGALSGVSVYPSEFNEGETGWALASAYSFVDAQSHLKENLKFLLQSATLTQPFSYASGTVSGPNADTVWSPDAYIARPPSPTDYEYYGFHVFSFDLNYSVMEEVRPAQENYLWRNFAYDPGDFDSSGGWTNGAGYSTSWPGLRWLCNPNYQFPCTNCDPLPSGSFRDKPSLPVRARDSAAIVPDSSPAIWPRSE